MSNKNFQKQGFKKTFGNWINTKAIPTMGKIGNQRHLSSIRDGFAIITPLIIASAIAIVLLTTIFGGWGSEKSSLLGVFANWANSGFTVDGKLTTWGKISDEMTRILGAMNQIGLGKLTVYFTFAFSFFLAKSRGNDTPEIAGLLALGCFFIATVGGASSASYIDHYETTTITHVLDPAKPFKPEYILIHGGKEALEVKTTPIAAKLTNDGYMGANGIFASLIVSIISTEVFCKLSKYKKFELTMPEGVPPAVSRAFAKLLPAMFTAGFITMLLAIVAIPTHLDGASFLVSTKKEGVKAVIAAKDSFYNLGDLFFIAIQSPFIYAASIEGANLGIAIFYTFLIGFFWLFGLHGTNIANGVFQAVWSTLLASNAALLTQGVDVLNDQGSIFVQGTFDAYIFLGGTGATLPLLIATLMFSKRKDEREIAKFSVPAGVFNINEPVVFGYPIVLNPVYVIPYLLAMPLITVTTYIFHLVFSPQLVAIQMPWTAPAGLGALFATGFHWAGPIIVLINFAVVFALYTPFVLLSSKKATMESKENTKDEKIKSAKVNIQGGK